jgi:hypothetical protein
MDVEATTAIRQAEVGAAKTTLDRTAEHFDVAPSRLVADGGYGSAEMVGWLVDERGIEPHVKLTDKSERKDGTFSRSEFAYDPEGNLYVCPGGKELKKRGRYQTRAGQDGQRSPGVRAPRQDASWPNLFHRQHCGEKRQLCRRCRGCCDICEVSAAPTAAP